MCYMLKYIRNFVFGLWYSAMQIMESWLYDPEGKGFGLSDGILPHVDVLTKIKEGPTGLGFGNSCNYENSILITNQEVAEKQGLMEGLSGGFWKTFSNSNGESLSNKVGGGQVSTSASPSFSLKAASGEEETGSKDLSSVIDIDSRDSSLIDLKLGRLCDFRDSKNTKSVEGARNFSSLASPIPAKRIRSTSLNGQTPFCQVRGCNLDLSSSKDYYKRHKVCEVHTKTVQVTVNGIQQRFCQQCSRFHLLAEFDDGKRSCRKRLAGHNERRRKPQIDIHSRRTGRVFQPYHGGRFQGTALSGRSSLVCPDMFPCGLLQDTNWLRHPKSSGGAIGNDMQLHTPVVDGQQVSKSFISFYGMEKQFPSLNGVHTASGNTFSEYGNRYDLGFASPNSVFDNGSTNEVFSGVSDSGCAHSLLSSKSQRSSMFLPAIPIAQPLISQDGNALHSKLPFSDKVSAGSQASTNVTSNSYYLSRLSTVRDGQMGLMVSSANNTVGLEVQTGDIFQGSHFSNAKDPISHEHGQTVDLLQLSSLLQNAEERRLALEVKQEYDPFSSLPIS